MSELHIPHLNRVLVAGRLTQDPEFRMTESGKVRTTMRLANNRNYRDSQGEWQQDTTFLTVTAWGRMAEAAAEHLSKGSAVLVEGRLRSRTIETSEGNRSWLEIVASYIQFLSRKEGTEGSEEMEEEQENKVVLV